MRSSLYRFMVGTAVAGGIVMPADTVWAADAASADLSSRGIIRPRAEAVIASDLNARIVALPFKKGERFKKGATLVEFDCRRYREELEAAKAENRAETATHDMNLKLERHKAIGRSEVLVSKAKVDRTAAQAKSLVARIDQCVIVAPFDGRVVDRNIQEHEMPQANAPLIKIVDDSRLEIDLIVPSKWLGWLSAGARFEFKVDETGQTLDGELVRTGAVVDPVSQTVDVSGVFKLRPESVLPGMSGTAVFQRPSQMSGPVSQQSGPRPGA